jgi:hypothetical protein
VIRNSNAFSTSPALSRCAASHAAAAWAFAGTVDACPQAQQLAGMDRPVVARQVEDASHPGEGTA